MGEQSKSKKKKRTFILKWLKPAWTASLVSFLTFSSEYPSQPAEVTYAGYLHGDSVFANIALYACTHPTSRTFFSRSALLACFALSSSSASSFVIASVM